MSHYLSLLLVLPLAGAVLVLCVPRRKAEAVRWLASGVALAGFLLSAPLWFWYDLKNPDFQLVERAAWIPSAGAEYFLGIDGISLLLILLTTLMGFIAVLSSWHVVHERVKEYFVALLVLQTGMLGAFMALDFLLFFVFWELTLAPIYFLIRIWGSSNRSRSALKYLAYALAGSLVMLIGILALYFHNKSVNGVYSFDITRFQTLSIPASLQWWVFLAFFFGLATRVPMFPFHTWLPDAHTDAPTAVSAILAAVLLKIGAYGFLRFSLPMLPDATRHFVPFIVVLSLAGIVYGGLAALAQKDWKRLVAYSSLSQMGMAMLGICALNPAGITGSVVQQLNHGISTGALLLLAGAMYERRRTREISEYGGLWRVTPAFAAVFFVVTVSSIGLPTLSAFVEESFVRKGVFAHGRLWAAGAAAGVVLSAAYLLSLYGRTMLGGAVNAENQRLPDLNAREWATLAPLVGLAVWMGFYPAPFLNRINVSVLKVAARVDAAYAADFAAACDTTVTPEKKAESPANQFLAAAPCGPDGQPLPANSAGTPATSSARIP